MAVASPLRDVPVSDGLTAVAGPDAVHGTALVLIHGLSLDHTIWDAQASALATQARVFRPDLRGHGASTASRGPYSIDGFADDVLRVFDAFSIDRAVVAGHSLGGFVALSFLRRFPERISGLMLVGSKAREDSDETRARRLELADQADQMARSSIAERDLRALFSHKTRNERPELLRSVRAMVERSDPQAGAASIRAMAARPDSSDLVARAGIPIAVLVGDEDRFVTIEESEATVRSAQLATLDVVPECGHHAMLEAPERTTQALRTLIALASSRVLHAS